MTKKTKPRNSATQAQKKRSPKKSSAGKGTTTQQVSNKRQQQTSDAGSKTNQVLALLRRPGGIAIGELMKVTGWQAHSVRGFLSGTARKKMGLKVTSTKQENGERTYSVSE